MPYLESRAVLHSILVGSATLFLAAFFARSLFWQNDPLSIYSITRPFGIATIFPLGMAFAGMRPWRGLLLTAVPVANKADDPLPTLAQLYARAKVKDY